MGNIREFPDSRAIDKEAATWLARLDADDDLDSREQASLREWLNRSPRHKDALVSLNQFWGNNILTELMVPLGRYEQQPGFFAAWKRKAVGWPGIATATAACLALVALSVLLFNPQMESNSNGLYVTAVGQQKTVLLDDGSLLQLNTDSQLEVDYTDNYRNLRLLQGEAYFEVKKNPDRPFRVYAGAGRVQAVGTAFNVLLNDAGMNVLVTEGSVALASLGEPVDAEELAAELAGDLAGELAEKLDIDPYVHSQSRDLGTLAAGECISLDATDDFLHNQQKLEEEVEFVDAAKISRMQSWREGFLVFSGEPLEKVVSEITRYTTLSINIADPALRQLQIGGRFKVGDTDSMFAALETNFGIEVRQLNYNQVELKVAQ